MYHSFLIHSFTDGCLGFFQHLAIVNCAAMNIVECIGSFRLVFHFLIGLLVFLEWSCVSSLYILEIKPLSEVSLANMFSHTVGSLLILMLFSLAVKKLFILMRSHLFILLLMSLALGDISVKILLHGISEIFFPVFFSSTFYGITTYI